MAIVSATANQVTVEFFGVARARAGRPQTLANGVTVSDVLHDVVRQCSGLKGLITASGELSRQFLVSIDGERFVDDPTQPVPDGSRLLILGADAGG